MTVPYEGDESVAYIAYSFQNGSSMLGSGDYVDFAEETFEETLCLWRDFHHVYRYQFSGDTPEGYSTDNKWEIRAVYKKAVE